MLTELDIQIYKLHKQGISVAEIHRTLNLGNIFKDCDIKLISIDRAFPNLQMIQECNLSWVKTLEPTPIYFKHLRISYTPIEGYNKVWDCGRDIYITK